MSSVLITGATGFIGSWLTEALLHRGLHVRALVRSSSSADNLNGLDVELVKGDYADIQSLRKAVEGVEYIYHVAGVTKALDEKTYIAGNVTATENLLQAACDAAPTLKRFLHVSSGAAVGPSPALDKPVDETAPCKPITLYGRTKFMAEEVCKKFALRLPLTIVRPSIIYGPRDKDLLEHFKAVKSGIVPVFGWDVEKRYDYLYVHDLVVGIIAAAESPKARGEVYFLSGAAHSWEEVGEAAKKALGKSFAIKVRLPDSVVYAVAALAEDIGKARGKISILNRDRARDGEQTYWIFSTEKARRDLGFDPQTSLDEGFRQTVAWYREHKWL